MVRSAARTRISLSEEQRAALERALRVPGVYEQIRVMVANELTAIESDLNHAARAALTNPEARVNALRLEGRLEQTRRFVGLLNKDWIDG